MASAREFELRIKSVKNIAQVTRALQAVSASRVRKAMESVTATRPYASKAWQVLTHVAGQPGRESLHPLLTIREEIKSIIVVMVSGERGLAGPYNTNILRYTVDRFDALGIPARYISVGRKGTELLYRLGKDILADFADLPAEPTFTDVSAIGRLAVDEYLEGNADEIHLAYTDFVTMLRQDPTSKKLLPLEFDLSGGLVEAEFTPGEERKGPAPAYFYEPSQDEILDEIIPSFTGLQVYQAVLESLASEHAARMVAMKNATDNATDMTRYLQLEYNKARQQSVTSEMLDIVGGAEALSQA